MKKVLLLLMIFGATSTQALTIQTFNLHNTTAASMIPVIEPLLPPGSAISGQGQQLIIRANAEDLNQIQQLLAQIDIPPQNLILSVSRTHHPGHDTEKALRDNVIVYNTQTKNRRDSTQQITVENGQAALITTGSAIPRRDYAVGYLGIARYSRYKNIRSGIIVTPTLVGDHVQLEINWQHQQLEDDRSQQLRETSPVQKEKINTVMTVPLGEWTNVGLTSTRNPETPQATTYDTANVSHPNSDIYIKVNIIRSNRQFDARVPQTLHSKFPTELITN